MGNYGAHHVEVAVDRRGLWNDFQHGIGNGSGIGAFHFRQYGVIAESRLDVPNDAVGLLHVSLL